MGRISEALDVLAHMKRLRLRPGHYAYNILIKFYCKRGEEIGSWLKAEFEERVRFSLGSAAKRVRNYGRSGSWVARAEL